MLPEKAVHYAICYQAGKDPETTKLDKSATLESMGFDSLDAIEIVMGVEEHSGIMLNEEAFNERQTIEEFTAAVTAQVVINE